MTRMLPKKLRPGYCTVCKRHTIFISFDNWLRESYKCIFCHCTPRERAVMNILDKVRPDWMNLKIHESSPSGRMFKVLKKKCMHYTYSYYYENKASGALLSDRCTNQNLEHMTFKDEAFDIILTQDVFEHINDPFSAFREVKRLLKEGGVHIVTVPIDDPFTKTVPRIKLVNGKRTPILPEIYHGNPIDKKRGALVTYDFGNDICDLIKSCSGMATRIERFDTYAKRDENARLGIEAHSLFVFVSKK